MRHVITFTLELPEHETTQCPACRATDMFAEHEVPEDYCKNDWHIAEREISLPACWAICERCKGEGTHVNPNIDGHGITAEEWQNDYDDESREMYMNGGYDVSCEAGCTGGKVLIPDVAVCNALHLAEYMKQQERAAQYDAEDRHTRFMESGGRD
jgi:hypothetical protein